MTSVTTDMIIDSSYDTFDLKFNIDTSNQQYEQGFHFDKEAVKKASAEIKGRLRQNGYKGLVDNNYYKGVGAAVESNWSLDHKLQAANLNWSVNTSILRYGDKLQFFDTNNQAVYRSDTGTLFSVTSDTWTPFQNVDVVNAFDEFCNSAGIEMERLGHLREGRLVFASAVVNESWAVMDTDDIIAARLLLTNSHEYGKGLTAKLNAIRLVCCNGITRKVSIGQRSISHTNGFSKAAVQAILESSKQNFVDLGLLIDKFAQTQVNNREAREILVETLGERNEQGNLVAYDDQNRLVQSSFTAFANHTSIGAHYETSRGTAWELLNCVTEQINHHSRSAGETHMNSMWNGGKARIESKMVNALALAYVSPSRNKQAQTVGVSAF